MLPLYLGLGDGDPYMSNFTTTNATRLPRQAGKMY